MCEGGEGGKLLNQQGNDRGRGRREGSATAEANGQAGWKVVFEEAEGGREQVPRGGGGLIGV